MKWGIGLRERKSIRAFTDSVNYHRFKNTAMKRCLALIVLAAQEWDFQ